MMVSIADMKGNNIMAAQGKTNRTQKNTVRVALTTAATIATLLGAQALAFTGNTVAQAQDTQPIVYTVPSGDEQVDSQQPIVAATPTAVPSGTRNRITVAPYQPRPRSHSSR
jgi:hypothetical protein